MGIIRLLVLYSNMIGALQSAGTHARRQYGHGAQSNLAAAPPSTIDSGNRYFAIATFLVGSQMQGLLDQPVAEVGPYRITGVGDL